MMPAAKSKLISMILVAMVVWSIYPAAAAAAGLEASAEIDRDLGVGAGGSGRTDLRLPPGGSFELPRQTAVADGGEFDAEHPGLELADHGRDLLHGCHKKRYPLKNTLAATTNCNKIFTFSIDMGPSAPATTTGKHASI